MRVHVVCLPDNWILHRYAMYLQKHLGWSVGVAPRRDVEVNHYLPYLLYEWQHKHPDDTRKTAWFTHLEENERKSGDPRSKTQRWHRANAEMDLRLCQAKKYLKILKSPAAQMPSPVDPIFKPRKLRVGVAGRVYRTGRKGEKMVARLHESREFEVVAAGSGWPCPTKMYERKELPDFFRSLDVFLVTSLVDGGPDTVIEALACGIPVVGPRDVGFVAELPVILYPKGDYDAMVCCLRRLVRSTDSVAGRTPQAWAEAHARAFEAYL